MIEETPVQDPVGGDADVNATPVHHEDQPADIAAPANAAAPEHNEEVAS